MIIAWLFSILLFGICIYATYVIINGLKEKDQYDIANLQSQVEKDTIIIKQAI
jgi:hypothetical protein